MLSCLTGHTTWFKNLISNFKHRVSDFLLLTQALAEQLLLDQSADWQRHFPHDSTVFSIFLDGHIERYALAMYLREQGCSWLSIASSKQLPLEPLCCSPFMSDLKFYMRITSLTILSFSLLLNSLRTKLKDESFENNQESGRNENLAENSPSKKLQKKIIKNCLKFLMIFIPVSESRRLRCSQSISHRYRKLKCQGRRMESRKS